MRKFKSCIITFLIVACMACLFVGVVACESSDGNKDTAPTMSVGLNTFSETLVLDSETKSSTVLYATVKQSSGEEYVGDYAWEVVGTAVSVHPAGATCVVEAEETGTAKVYVSVENFSAYCDFEVVENAVTTLTMSKSELSLAPNGEGTVTVEARYADGTEFSDFEYELSVEGVVFVTREGSVLTVVAGDVAGDVTLTVTADGLQKSCLITVSDDSGSGAGEEQGSSKITDVTMETSHTMTAGETWELIASVTMSEGSYEGEYKWSSSDTSEEIIKLTANDATATIEAVGAGNATVTLVVGEGGEDEKTVSCVVTVEEAQSSPTITSVVMASSHSMAEGDTWQLVANVFMSEGSYEGEYKWSSSDTSEAIIKLTTNGATATIEAVGAGEVTVTLVVGEGGEDEKTVSCVISVEAKDVYEAAITLEDTALAKGDSTTASVSFTKNDGAYESEGTVKWESSDNTVVTVAEDSDGNIIVTAVNAGTATITVTLTDEYAGEVVGTYEITVTAAEARAVSISFDTTSTLLKGSTYQISAVVTMSDGTSVYEGAYTWESSGEEIATVESNNATASTTITAIGAGNAAITVTLDNGVTDSIEITVIQANVSTITITLEPETMTKGSASYATANVTMDIDGVIYGGGYSWTSSDPEKLIISGTGNTVTVTAVGAGTFTLTVTLDGGEGDVTTGTLEITVADVATYTVGDENGLIAALNSDAETLYIVFSYWIDVKDDGYAALAEAFLGEKNKNIYFNIGSYGLSYQDNYMTDKEHAPFVLANGINVVFFGDGDGNLDFNPEDEFGYVMYVTDGSTLTVYNLYEVRVTGTGNSLFMVEGSGSGLYFIDTYLYSEQCNAISTDASYEKDQTGVTVELVNTFVRACDEGYEDRDATAIYFDLSTDNYLIITNCIIQAATHALVVKGGTVTVTNTDIVVTCLTDPENLYFDSPAQNDAFDEIVTYIEDNREYLEATYGEGYTDTLLEELNAAWEAWMETEGRLGMNLYTDDYGEDPDEIEKWGYKNTPYAAIVLGNNDNTGYRYGVDITFTDVNVYVGAYDYDEDDGRFGDYVFNWQSGDISISAGSQTDLAWYLYIYSSCADNSVTITIGGEDSGECNLSSALEEINGLGSNTVNTEEGEVHIYIGIGEDEDGNEENNGSVTINGNKVEEQ